MVVLPVFLQAPWVHIYPLSACLFTLVIVIGGISLVKFGGEKWSILGSLLLGVSGSWLCGCLFWGWLREYPVWHLPIEALVLPLAFLGVRTVWSIGSAFYLASLLGTAFTDLTMLLTGVMDFWPKVVSSQLDQASGILNETAKQLLGYQQLFWLLFSAIVILYISKYMKNRSINDDLFSTSWLVASAALTTTLWVDGLFLLTALIQPRLSGLI
tara:strand:+ start:352 stop:990 length:639 start_codon:yes stop_codon:yes gene_type:complete